MRLDLMKLRSATQESARHVDNVLLSLSSIISLFPAVLCCRCEREGCGPNLKRGAGSNAMRLASSLLTSRVGLNAGIGRVRRRSRTKPGPHHSLHRARALDSAVRRQSLPCLER
jgi:hypothetical protein